MPAPPSPVDVTWLGHATTLLELGGTRVLTDPLLTNRVARLRRRRPIEVGDIGTIDVGLLSHTHTDHLHLPSLRLLGKDVALVVPAGSGAWLRARGFPNVTELAPGERTEVGPLAVTATRAVHRSGRGPGISRVSRNS